MLVPGAIGVGAIVPVQTAVNTRLRADVRDPVVTALYSFLIGTTTLLPVAWLLTGQPLPDFALLADAPLWLFLGGPLGVAFIVGNILLFPQIGSVHTVIMPIVGQMLMGLLVDHFGLFGYDVLPISPLRLFGALIVLVATAVVLDIGRGRLWEGRAQGVAAWAWRGFGIAIGMGSATQTAVNGRLGAVIGAPIHAGLLSLAVGVAVLFILSLVLPGRSRVFRPIPVGPWWKWLGGVLGAFFVVGGALFAPILGTRLMVIAALSGTITAGQLLESRGWIGATKRPLTVRRVSGLVGIFLGVVLVRMV